MKYPIPFTRIINNRTFTDEGALDSENWEEGARLWGNMQSETGNVEDAFGREVSGMIATIVFNGTGFELEAIDMVEDDNGILWRIDSIARVQRPVRETICDCYTYTGITVDVVE